MGGVKIGLDGENTGSTWTDEWHGTHTLARNTYVSQTRTGSRQRKGTKKLVKETFSTINEAKVIDK